MDSEAGNEEPETVYQLMMTAHNLSLLSKMDFVTNKCVAVEVMMLN